MRVLVVEDERLLSNVLSDFLRRRGDQPLAVGDAETALAVLERDPPDVVLLDIKLPGMSGLDLLRIGPMREAGVPVIVMSGVAREAQAREALALGALDFLAKPVPFPRLAEMLDLAAVLAPPAGQVKPMKPDRRPAPRAKIPVSVSVTVGASTRSGTCSDVSTSGMKVGMAQPPRRGATVRLTFALPDATLPLDVLANVVRVDPDGAAFWFLDLGSGAATRINKLVGTTSAAERAAR